MNGGYGLPHLADGTDVVRWADQRSAQSDLPRLVRRLIRHENDQVQRVEMRGGEGVGLPGYDGIVEATRATSFVPDGFSVWEMGVDKDPAGKATDDYKTRTADSLGVDMSTATFVFVTPRRWRKKKDWEQKRRAEGKWKDVRVLDADDIEQALEEAAAVRIWLSEVLDMPALGAVTIEDWWRRFSGGFDPRLTPPVVLAGRENEAAELLRRLLPDVGKTFIKAASVDDGLAFAACTMLAQEPDAVEPMLSRFLLVHDGITLRRLDSASRLLILLPYEEHLQREAQQIANHHIVFVVTEGDAHIELPPLDHLTLEAALRDAGVADGDLGRYARAGNKSLLALQRVSAKSRQPGPDEWAEDLSDRIVRRAWLAGAWSHLRSGDAEVVEALTGGSSEDVEERLQNAIRRADPLFTRVGSTWAVLSPQDSWSAARHAIGEADLQALERAVQTVLGAVDPSLELPPEERWTAGVYGKVRVHSTDLRNGLARSVALLSSHGDESRLAGGRSARQWAERVVWSLLRRANEDPSGRLWGSIQDVLPLLAESAPDVFLRSTAEAISGDDPLLAKLFQDQSDSWHVSSPHTGLLWALEGVAWSNRHLGFASEILARLAELDPGGKLSNRPASSLQGIFCPWLPQTSAPVETRIMTLDALLERHEEVTWKLLLSLLPEHHAVGMPTHKPRFRDWAPAGDRAVTYGEYFEVVEAVAERVLRLAVTEPRRWTEVVPEFDRLPPPSRTAAIAHLEELSTDDPAEDVARALWDALEKFIRRHRAFPDADWSVGEEWLTSLSAIAARVRPARGSEQHRWLFDDWHPDLGASVRGDYEARERELHRARERAVTTIVADEGFPALTGLAQVVRLPWAVGSALARSSEGFDREALSLLDSEVDALVQFADGFARMRGSGQTPLVRQWVEEFDGRPLTQARLLLTLDDVRDAWAMLTDLPEEVDGAYWAQFTPYGRGAEFPYASEAARQLLKHGRAAMAVDALSLYARRDAVDVDVVVEALNKLGTVVDPEAGLVSEHDLTTLLDYLRAHGADEAVLARLEWKFLPALRDEPRAESLQRRVARDPASFVQLVAYAFKSSSQGSESDPPRVSPELAANAYRFLREWRMVPGTNDDGVVEQEGLQSWLRDVRAGLHETGHLEVGELQIGEVFAHSPSESDGTFPARAIRNVLEAAPNDRFERGFIIGLHNKQGITSRGMTDGGMQEYELARRYDQWAARIEATHPRTAGALRSVADSYREEGRRNDEEVQRYLEGMDF